MIQGGGTLPEGKGSHSLCPHPQCVGLGTSLKANFKARVVSPGMLATQQVLPAFLFMQACDRQSSSL